MHGYICEILYRVVELQTCANRIVDAIVITMIVIISRDLYRINEQSPCVQLLTLLPHVRTMILSVDYLLKSNCLSRYIDRMK